MLPAVIVLAAGLSRRFGNDDKLIAQVAGRPMVAHVFDTVRTVEACQRVVVTQPGSEVIGLAEGFEVVINPDPEAGMGLSIALGVAALRPDIEAVFVVLGDMPFVEASTFGVLAGGEADIVVPVYGGQQGHPVLFGRACFEELNRLSGQAGARRLIESGRYRVVEFELAGTGGLVDLDTKEDVLLYTSPRSSRGEGDRSNET
ncbi:mobA-like protein [Asticcacaulis biprosthecium C19]|uniref:MobA-like protein n=1 Tax=Asticcacaulis biprosthecium C19 TaxID=715226 RepID=F4QH71_9CAUL|nr:nucleotidyltransferase family protein [Asticcacaulis biprosthecium]EGF92608.1 mobA-like protein [Asticcacaulis biprosthecium C19]